MNHNTLRHCGDERRRACMARAARQFVALARASLRARRIGAAVLVTLASSGVPAAAATPAPLPIRELTAGMHRIQAEVADREETRRTGLMHRRELAPNHGMLFVFENATLQCFWMRNTPLPLSIAFLADDGQIINIADMTPQSEDVHCSAQPVRYALEMQQGWFAERGIQPGMALRGLP